MTVKRSGGGRSPATGPVGKRARGSAGLSGREVLFEFRRVGNVMRVVAIDPASGVEVIMVADPRQSKTVIQRLAAQKLAYVLAKKNASK